MYNEWLHVFIKNSGSKYSYTANKMEFRVQCTLGMFYGWVDSKAEMCPSVAIITIVFGIFSL